MLQIISGKFYSSDANRRHNPCKGILYSKRRCISTIYLNNIEIQPVDWSPGLPPFVISFDNQIEFGEKDILIKTGDDEVIRQLKAILTFSLNSIFDENESTVELLQASKCKDYIEKIFDSDSIISQDELDFCEKFYEQMIGLPRLDYKNILKCLIAYQSSLKLLKEDFTLAYSILVYALETLAANYDGYTATWADYPQNQKDELDAVLSLLPEDKMKKTKKILLSNSHLKLSKRFVEFAKRYISFNFYTIRESRCCIAEDELENALSHAYVFRSEFAHILQPIMKEIVTADNKNSDVFQWQHNLYFTYSGLARLTREVITNFTFSREVLEYETYPWRNDLPGIIQVELAPSVWLGKQRDINGISVLRNFEGLLNCLASGEHTVPNMQTYIENILDHYDNMNKQNRVIAMALSKLYIMLVSNLDQEFKEIVINKVAQQKDIFESCNIYNLTLGTFPNVLESISWPLDSVVQVVEKYRAQKFKKNHLKLPHDVEATIYFQIGKFKVETNDENATVWLRRAYTNSCNNKQLQDLVCNFISINNIDIGSAFT